VHTKGNAIDDDVLNMLEQSLSMLSHEYKALIIYNDGRQFSSGANLSYFLDCIDKGDFDAIEKLIQTGQENYQALRQINIPVVAGVSGLSLGGGCEIALHCDAIQAYAEINMGLVEASVGLVPAWGGCKELIIRHLNVFGAEQLTPEIAIRVFNVISTANISGSAALAMNNQLITNNDCITMNRDRLLADAKNFALKLSDNYKVPAEKTVKFQGEKIHQILFEHIEENQRKGLLTKHDVIVQQALAEILSANGKNCTLKEKDILELESKSFIQLSKTDGTRERIQHMLKTKKPLRN
jgi:3-hydroxyacyl-CoA dehydrogenase